MGVKQLYEGRVESSDIAADIGQDIAEFLAPEVVFLRDDLVHKRDKLLLVVLEERLEHREIQRRL